MSPRLLRTRAFFRSTASCPWRKRQAEWSYPLRRRRHLGIKSKRSFVGSRRWLSREKIWVALLCIQEGLTLCLAPDWETWVQPNKEKSRSSDKNYSEIHSIRLCKVKDRAQIIVKSLSLKFLRRVSQRAVKEVSLSWHPPHLNQSRSIGAKVWTSVPLLAVRTSQLLIRKVVLWMIWCLWRPLESKSTWPRRYRGRQSCSETSKREVCVSRCNSSRVAWSAWKRSKKHNVEFSFML